MRVFQGPSRLILPRVRPGRTASCGVPVDPSIQPVKNRPRARSTPAAVRPGRLHAARGPDSPGAITRRAPLVNILDLLADRKTRGL
jgi:hypothetical protein